MGGAGRAWLDLDLDLDLELVGGFFDDGDVYWGSKLVLEDFGKISCERRRVFPTLLSASKVSPLRPEGDADGSHDGREVILFVRKRTVVL